MTRRYRYYPWKAPGYWLFAAFCGYMSAALAGPVAPHLTIGSAVLGLFALPRWRSFVLIERTGMILSPDRIYIRGITTRFGIRRADCIISSIMHVGAKYEINIWKFEDLRTKSRPKYFFGDDFNFWGLALARFSSSLGLRHYRTSAPQPEATPSAPVPHGTLPRR